MLTCPKCQSEMRSYERNGINIDQCSGCRGIYLDRGELEHLIDAEGSFYGAGQGGAQAAPAAATPPPVQPQVNYGTHIPQYQRTPYQQPGGYYKKKKSFLSEFLDFD